MKKSTWIVLLLLICCTLLTGCQPPQAAAPTDIPLPTATTAPTDPPLPTPTTTSTNTPVPTPSNTPTPRPTSPPLPTPAPLKATLFVPRSIEILAAAALPTATLSPDPVQITWAILPYGYLATGAMESIFKLQREIVQSFNEKYAGQIVVATVNYSANELADLNGPDLFDNYAKMPSKLLNLGNYLKDPEFLSLLPAPQILNAFSTPEGAIGVPVFLTTAVFFYNPADFEKAGLNPPPKAYNEPYIMPDGSEVEWSFVTVAWIAQRLTIDRDGRNAAETELSRGAIVNYGFASEIRTELGTQPFTAPSGAQGVFPTGASMFLFANSFYIGELVRARGADTLLPAPLPSSHGTINNPVGPYSEGFFISKDAPQQETVLLFKHIFEHEKFEVFCHTHRACAGGLLAQDQALIVQTTESWKKGIAYREIDFSIMRDGLLYIRPSLP